MNEKEKLKIKIEELLSVKLELSKLDQDNSKVKENIELINEQLLDYQLQSINVKTKITFKTFFINRFLKSKTVFLNLSLIILEILNRAEVLEMLGVSDNKLISNLAIIIPALTIYLRVKQKDDND